MIFQNVFGWIKMCIGGIINKVPEVFENENLVNTM